MLHIRQAREADKPAIGRCMEEGCVIMMRTASISGIRMR